LTKQKTKSIIPEPNNHSSMRQLEVKDFLNVQALQAKNSSKPHAKIESGTYDTLTRFSRRIT